MKILFVTTSSINGGAQKHIRDMFIKLTKLGHKVYIVAPKGWLMDELKEYGANCFSFNLNIKTITKLEKIFNDVKPDVTNTFILSGGVFGVLAWSKKKYGKIFVTVNNPVIYDGITYLRKLLYPLMYRWMSKYVSAFLVKSDNVADEVRNIIKNNIPVLSIKNGIDFENFDYRLRDEFINERIKIKNRKYVITNVAALEERKGQSYLVEAVKRISLEYNVHLFLVGEGSYRSYLEKLTHELGTQNIVTFMGRRSDINKILAETDVFVLPSCHEGLPNALMEAMAMNVPCIASDVGGVRQLIEDQVNGIVVRPKNIGDIVKAIRLYIENKDLAINFANSAYLKIKREYELENVALELERIYCSY